MSLLAHYYLNESGSNNSIFPAVGNLTGVFNGANTSDNSKSGPGGLYTRSLDFAGSNYATFASNPLVSGNQFTISAWTYSNTTGQSFAMIVAGNTASVDLRLNAERPDTVINSDLSSELSGSIFPTGTWRLLTITHNGINFNLYENGSLVNTKVSSGGANFSSQLEFGARGTSLKYNGRIAGVKIYDNALSNSEISGLYFEARPVSTSGISVTGYPRPGNTLVCSTGTWSDGLFSGQWYKSPNLGTGNGIAIVNATGLTYTPVDGDVGQVVYILGSGNNSYGSNIAVSNLNIVGGYDVGAVQTENMPRHGTITVRQGRRSNSKIFNLTLESISGINSCTFNRFDDIGYYVTG